ncbi:hypothetical protein C8J57DRAFT_1058855, partial [Mycena rebaudengoi]
MQSILIIQFAGEDPTNEAAAAKMWAVYVSEAEKYDRALVDSWRTDMQGLLIFAGLFSASLTAFLVESYKTLKPDSGDLTVTLLRQISLQLAAAAEGSTLPPLVSNSFTAPASSLICNFLWFISLILSLTCAVIATLLEQWARDFLHKADMHSTPVIRARMFSYLYYGLKRFNMHTVIELIPILLHGSLLFFFAGLVAFLAPVNSLLTALVATSLGLVVAVYMILTLLPLAFLDCPYRTPLSGLIWRFSRMRHLIGVLRGSPPNINSEASQDSIYSSDTMLLAMSRQASSASEERTARDVRALTWTVRSLADDSELEPFIESIPDMLWGAQGRRWVYDRQIRVLVDDRLCSRIENLLRSCDSGLLSPDATKRRQTVCYKVLWAISSLSKPGDSSASANPRFDL